MSENPAAGKPYEDGDKVHLFLAYFGLLSLIPFLMFKDQKEVPAKEFVYWHARQGLALFISVVVVAIPCAIISVIPIIGWIIGCLGWIVIMFGSLGGAIMGWIKAFGGEKWEIPLVSKVANMLG
ncbi:MAG: DUF4870 domain-containing protein [Acidobacteria bacterium]|nr:DUF4870 domain-containing protein [Acidobacteriota bacterium]